MIQKDPAKYERIIMDEISDHSNEIKTNPIEKLSEGIRNANTQLELQKTSIAIDEAVKKISVSDPKDVPLAMKYVNLYSAVESRSRELARQAVLPIGVIERQNFSDPKYDQNSFVQDSSAAKRNELLSRVNLARVRVNDPLMQEVAAAERQ